MGKAERQRAANVIPVVHNMPADLLTPLAVYLKLSANARHSFLLESVEGGRNLARYSFIGADPEMVVSSRGENVEVIGRDGSTVDETNLISFLKHHFEHRKADHDQDLPAFIGGAIGYLGFDCCGWFEPSLKRSGQQLAAAFMLLRSIVAFDHARQLITIISLVFVDEMGNASRGDLIDDASRRNLEIKNLLDSEMPAISDEVPDNSPVTVSSNWDRYDFEAAVSRIKDLIYAGECYQAVLSQCFTRQTKASPIAIYRALRSLNPSPYMFLLRFDQMAVVGASPEMLVRCEGKRLEYRPIAGTRPRGRDPHEDDELAREMQLDKKEVAEHLMLVDLGRNDLGRVAKYGSVRVETLMDVEKYSHVQHLVSSLSAELDDGLDCFDALAACFPAGTVSGAPKVAATRIIGEMEPTPRGIYAGAVGYLDFAGNLDFCITIRTLVITGQRATVQAGAGIVADSNPSAEYQETQDKAKALVRALELAQEGL